MAHEVAAPPTDQTAPSKSERRWFLAIAAVFVLLALAYGVIIPLGFGPDEPRHYLYIPLMLEQHQLPRVLPDGRELQGAIALHPPLYYAILSVFYFPLKALGGTWLAQRVFRLFSPAFGVVTLGLIWATCRRVFPERPGLALFIPAMMAVWPHFVMDHSVMNNDNGANLAGALFIYFLVSRPGGAWSARSALLGGLVLGIGALMKGQLLLCLTPVFIVVMAWDHGRDFLAQTKFWRNLVLALGTLIVVAGWWYARNFWLYGELNYVAPGYAGLPPGVSFIDALAAGYVWMLVHRTIVGIFLSIWAQVGWFPEAIAGSLYTVLGVLLAVAGAGWVCVAFRAARRKTQVTPRRARDLTAVMLPFLTIYLLIHYVVIFVHQGPYQGGRYAMFAFAGFVTFLALGWEAVAPRKLRAVGAAVLLAFFLLLNAVSMWNLITYLNPTHAAAFNFWTTMPGT